MQERAFNHVTNHVAMHHDHGDGLMVPLSYLDVMMMKTQEWLFNPNVHNVTIAAVMEDCMGFKEQKNGQEEAVCDNWKNQKLLMHLQWATAIADGAGAHCNGCSHCRGEC